MLAQESSIFAPGRVNLIGEHTDHSGGLVLPVAVDRGVTLRWRPDTKAIRLHSAGFPETVELAPDGTPAPGLTGWGRYPAAVATLLRERGRPAAGLNGTASSTVPIGAGLSSSAALTVAIGLALCRAAEFELPWIELAHVARDAEHRAVGVPVGLMDPAASLLAHSGHALLLDCGTEEYRHVPLPDDLAIAVLDSGVRRRLEHSGYATRRAELERALPALGGARPSQVTEEEAATAARAAGVDEIACRRLRHVVSENVRVREFVAVLEAGSPVDVDRLGEIMSDGHRSLRDDYEVSIPELDLLVEIACEAGAIGARLTGGGFGGSVVALVPAERAGEIAATAAERYRERTGREGAGYVLSTSDGARDLD